jgi:hypothetical protein
MKSNDIQRIAHIYRYCEEITDSMVRFGKVVKTSCCKKYVCACL